MQTPVISPKELYLLVESRLGTFQAIADLRAGSARTGVWKLQAAGDGNYYYLKTYSRKERWQPEVYAYRHWVGSLGPYAPELVAAFEGEGWQAILITAVEGMIMQEAELAPAALQAAYYRAGQLTKIMHDSQTGKWFGRPDQNGQPIELFHHPDPVAYIHESLRDIGGECLQAELLQTAEQEALEWALQNAGAFKGARPVPVSWDSTPGNWLVKADGEFSGMIDFENMLWGVDVDSFAILFAKYFIHDEAARDAFFAGYGPDTLRQKQTQIRISCIKLAAGDIYWGTKYNMPGFIARGRRLLQSWQQLNY